MNNVRSKSFLISILLISFVPTLAHATWTGLTDITQIRPSTTNSAVFLITSDPLINPEGCSNTTNYAIPESSSVYKELAAVALSSMVGNYSVNIWVNGCYATGAHTFPKIDDIIIYK